MSFSTTVRPFLTVLPLGTRPVTINFSTRFRPVYSSFHHFCQHLIRSVESTFHRLPYLLSVDRCQQSWTVRSKSAVVKFAKFGVIFCRKQPKWPKKLTWGWSASSTCCSWPTSCLWWVLEDKCQKIGNNRPVRVPNIWYTPNWVKNVNFTITSPEMYSSRFPFMSPHFYRHRSLFKLLSYDFFHCCI